MRHEGSVKSAVFSPDGQWILTTDPGGSGHLWSTSTKKELGLGIRQAGGLFDAAFSPDGRYILTTGITTAAIWEIEGDMDLPAKLFKLQARAVTGEEYVPDNSETRCINAKDWYPERDQYDKQAGQHSAVCKYPRYNLWRRFQP
jgi:WD40 repeat protein